MSEQRAGHITRGQTTGITLAGFAIVFLIWNIDALSMLAYPFRFFVTYVHEAGHSLMAVLTGGEIIRFTVSADGSGLATTAGGSRALILPAGYLGAAFFGSALFYAVNRFPRLVRPLAVALGIGLIIFTALYARPDASGVPVAIVIGLLGGFAIAVIGLRASQTFGLLALNVLAIMTALNAVLDVTGLVNNADACMRTGDGLRICNDAAAFHNEVAPFLPASVWAFIWAGLAIGMVGIAAYFSLLHPYLRDVDVDLDGDDASPRAPGSSSRRRRSKTSDDPLAGLKRDKDGNIDWSQF